ncbi:hypothetical protein LshimejAT787_0603020 [Lyophyllum shimeji]|uniref:Uncharacterized protein n=1 Tax=Lyophyllum shimeji TaxID=47721 RepID=A0A9P3PNJ0_LYOSH|nr:hypothetical protein LshimejAT787_0603020 [Lyophyllum shimeji]
MCGTGLRVETEIPMDIRSMEVGTGCGGRTESTKYTWLLEQIYNVRRLLLIRVHGHPARNLNENKKELIKHTNPELRQGERRTLISDGTANVRAKSPNLRSLM